MISFVETFDPVLTHLINFPLIYIFVKASKYLFVCLFVCVDVRLLYKLMFCQQIFIKISNSTLNKKGDKFQINV